MAKQKSLPKAQNGAHILLQQQETRAMLTSGPIPDAASLSAYGKVREDLPDIIIEEWRKEAADRRGLAQKNAELAEREVVIREKAAAAASRNETLRIMLGAAFVAGAFYLAWLLVKAGNPESAIVMTALPAIASLVGAGLKFFKK